MARKAESPVRPPGSPRPDEADNQASGCDSTNSEFIPAGRVRGPADLKLDLLGFGEQQAWVAPPQDLESYLMRSRLCFQLIPQRNDTVTFEPCPVPPMLAREEVDWDAMEDELRDTPVFRLSEVERFRDVERGKVYEVDIRGATYAYKMTHGTESLQREISMLRKMEQCSEGGRSLRVPELEGIIGIGTQYAGLLMTYIPSPASLADLMTADIGSEVAIAERQKWYDLIADAVHTLHRNGLVWGDVKAANVVIDGVHRDAWLVDFEGGTTPGWVDDSISGTEAGDLQGLSKIRALLGLESTRPSQTGSRRGLDPPSLFCSLLCLILVLVPFLAFSFFLFLLLILCSPFIY
ncbi:uncharacterized protein BO66DRAFT_455133 [Aspergillus aculeatinus CBS 121060]|uniref:Uncharacterized protein n=1 Tax=Aspergillus aculeatinus CBS 121060 TaxID=1448322 RepID=A0ACD1H4J8_9EURO|nr:hypothetical protein BO66DRAFT_455133 [Aspergillus aculeatinus CBS 121060]RAH68479.1 hypothetical protein BO66DRAFT_455133 [Aspergillus aculeatinus CBS 121060]